MRRGQHYCTILVDLERRRVIDLLPDREAATLATWLGAHPGVEIVCRDRGQSYAEGARVGAPSAIHVADRFHLVHNVVDALGQVCARDHRALRSAARDEPPAGATNDVGESSAAPRRRRYSGLPRNRPGPTAAERRSAARRAAPGPLRGGRGAPGRRPEQAGDCAPTGARPAHRRHVARRRPFPRAHPAVGPPDLRRPIRRVPGRARVGRRVERGATNA